MACRFLIFHLTLVLLALFADCQTPNKSKKFTIWGEIKGTPREYIYLEYTDSFYRYKIDSSKIKNNKFFFSGYLNEPCLATIKADRSVRDFQEAEYDDFFLEASDIMIRLDKEYFKRSVYTGSTCDSVYKKNLAIKKPIHAKLKELNDRFYAEKNETIKNRIEAYYLMELKKLLAIDLQFINENLKSYTSLHLLRLICDKISYKEFDQLYTSFNSNLKETNLGTLVYSLLEKSSILAINKPCPQFSQIDFNGNLINSSDFKGKYVILDFWASWCVPCRRTFKFLKQKFYKYKNQGLVIVAISSDEEPKVWRDAIKNDALELWYNILDTNKNNSINDLYAVNELPTKYLIDTSGNILGKYYAGDDELLYAKLREIFRIK